MRIPQELVDLIVDNLHDDIPSLKSCSLTARAFVGSAQTWLFNSVEILPPKSRDDQDSPCRRFYKLLTRSPHIAPLIEELQIVLVGSETSAYDAEGGYYLEERHVPWVMSGRTLSLVLALLNLKRISLVENSSSEWNGYGRYSMQWNKLGRSLKSALAAVFSSPRLESVCLRGIVVQSPVQLLSLFSEATSLKELSISRVYFTQVWSERTSWPESQPWNPQLQSLLVSDVDSGPLCCYLLHPQIDLTRITSLTLATRTVEWKEKMSKAISGMTHLALYQPHWTGIALESILTPSLRSIHFFSADSRLLIPAIFEACPDNSRLERIVFEGSTNSFLTRLHPLAIDARIEAAMVNLRALKSVEIRAYFQAYSYRMFHKWAEDVRAALPSLVGRGLLILTEIPRVYVNPWE
ncbi:hypothetical protein MSAN_00792400 [Mycena sanguinolenta]|uniref:Uncharacterized protein n=1 Tax=Mycena sanguinolenta TaxID=230812 RepID=A0A8H7DCQ1_9AGAR|nr:hypothetical protein MSAN_00792400 [Mycena sanguinolenta]